jgi:hypothetical protein
MQVLVHAEELVRAADVPTAPATILTPWQRLRFLEGPRQISIIDSTGRIACNA